MSGSNAGMEAAGLLGQGQELQLISAGVSSHMPYK
jgi:hypothetical protein